MNHELENHPLNGINLETLLGELVRHYGWEILAEQININAFKSYPNFKASMKFLKKTPWAREKLEAFYLYKFMQFARPDDVQHQLPPRERKIDLNRVITTPMVINLGDPEFFDDPISGRVLANKKPIKSRRSNTKAQETMQEKVQEGVKAAEPVNPWANWKDKNE